MRCSQKIMRRFHFGLDKRFECRIERFICVGDVCSLYVRKRTKSGGKFCER